jgi:triphosphatase
MQVGINAAGLLESSDPEYLHQMRVGLRRLRSALRAFAPVLDNAKAVKRWLRDLMPPLGAARDWDVFAQTLQEAQARTAILQKVRRRHNAARRVARDTVSSPKFQSFLLGSLQWLQSEPWRDSSASLERFGAQALERLHRKAVKHADWGGASERHQLRIRVKRLRYACEFFAPCFAPAAVAPYLEQLQALQDILGELNDIAVGRALCCEIDAPAPRQLAQREKKLIAALTPAWNRFEKQPRYWRHRG